MLIQANTPPAPVTEMSPAPEPESAKTVRAKLEAEIAKQAREALEHNWL